MRDGPRAIDYGPRTHLCAKRDTGLLMILYGTTHHVGDGVTAGDIIAPEWRDAGDPAVLAAHCLAGIDPAIAEHAREGDVLLAGRDFGGGLDPDIAALALQAAGFAAIVCA